VADPGEAVSCFYNTEPPAAAYPRVMSTHAQSTFTVKNWDEHAYNEVDGHLKLTRATVAFGYTGDLEGDGAIEYLMMYQDDGSARSIALERFSGRLNGKSGTFVLEHHANYADGTNSGEFDVIAGSGTGQLASLRGHGTSLSRQDGTMLVTLDYDLG